MRVRVCVYLQKNTAGTTTLEDGAATRDLGHLCRGFGLGFRTATSLLYNNLLENMPQGSG